MSSKSSLTSLGLAFVLIVFASCGGASPASNKDGGGNTGAGGAGGNVTGAGGDMTGAGGDMTGAGGDMTGAGGDMTGAGGAGGDMTGAGGATGGGGNGGATGGGGKGGATGGGGKGGATGNRDGGVGDAGSLAMCKHATTCNAGDPSPCLRACGTGRDATCECGTGALAGKLVCETVCERPDGGGSTADGGTVPACPANIKSGTTTCTPRTETTCETPCAAMMHHECICAATAGTKGVWFCFKATTCQ
jgi:hypothetical protein